MKNFKKIVHAIVTKAKGRTVPRPYMSFGSHPGALGYVPPNTDGETPSETYVRMAKEGYGQNIIVYRAVSLIARNLSSVTWRLSKNDTVLEDHPLLDLMTTPNPRQTGVSFLESLCSYLLLAGNAYVELVMRPEGVPELYLLRPDRVRVIPEAQGHHYLYTVGAKKRVIKRPPNAMVAPLLHLKMFHPLNDWYGMSALQAAEQSIHQHNAVGEHNLSFLKNGGRPSGALIAKDSSRRHFEREVDSFHQQISENFKGAHNAGRVVLLEGDLEWKEIGVKPRDLDYVPGKHLSAREIAQAYGVPAMLVGVPGDATFANYREARLHLWEDTILPLLDKIIAEVNRWITPLYGGALSFSYDKESIPALVARRDSLWSRMENCSFLTEDEKREALGYASKAAPKESQG